MSEKHKHVLLVGILLLAAGTGLYIYSLRSEPKGTDQRELAAREINARNQLREADEYLRQNSAEGAARAQRILTRLYSDETLPLEINQLARYGLGVALQKQGERSAALGHFRALKEKGPHNQRLADRVDYSLGRLLLRINHDSEGRALLQSLLARTNENVLKSRIHTALGAHDLRHGRSRAAAENFSIALKYNPDNLQAELGKARARSGSGRGRMAFDYYDDYLTGTGNLDPRKRRKVQKHLTSEHYQLGVAAYRSGDYSRATYHLRHALRSGVNPVTAERILYLLADSHYHRGNRKEAMRLFERVLSNAEPSMDQPALIKKGILLFQAGRPKEAAALFMRAETGYPNTIYSERAREWRLEAETLIRENSKVFDGIDPAKLPADEPSDSKKEPAKDKPAPAEPTTEPNKKEPGPSSDSDNRQQSRGFDTPGDDSLLGSADFLGCGRFGKQSECR